MREISQMKKNMIKSGVLTEPYTGSVMFPTYGMAVSGVESININRSINDFCASFSFSFFGDQLLKPNDQIDVFMGVGTDLAKQITGYVDTVRVKYTAEGKITTVNGRDVLKRLLDQSAGFEAGGVLKFSHKFQNLDYAEIVGSMLAAAGFDIIDCPLTGITGSFEVNGGTFADNIKVICDKIGYTIYATEEGIPTFRPVSVPGEVVWAYEPGVDLMDSEVLTDDSGVYNAIFLYNKKTGVKLQSYVGGIDAQKFEKKILTEESESYTAANMPGIAQKINQKIIREYKQYNHQISGNPYLQIGDTIEINTLDLINNSENTQIINSYSIDLAEGDMTMTISCSAI